MSYQRFQKDGRVAKSPFLEKKCAKIAYRIIIYTYSINPKQTKNVAKNSVVSLGLRSFKLSKGWPKAREKLLTL